MTRDVRHAGRRYLAPNGLTLLMSIAIVALLVLTFVPGVRQQFLVSTREQPVDYVELYFPDPAAARACASQGTGLPLQFRLRSHLAEGQGIGYRITVSPDSARSAGRTTTVSGTLNLAAGGVGDVDRQVIVPQRGAYTVHVVLPERRQQLLLHCRTAGAEP